MHQQIHLVSESFSWCLNNFIGLTTKSNADESTILPSCRDACRRCFTQQTRLLRSSNRVCVLTAQCFLPRGSTEQLIYGKPLTESFSARLNMKCYEWTWTCVTSHVLASFSLRCYPFIPSSTGVSAPCAFSRSIVDRVLAEERPSSSFLAAIKEALH